MPNGVERRVIVDTGAAASIIHNNLDPRKDRKFKVIGAQSYYLSSWHNVYRRRDNSNMTSTRENYLQCSEIYWSSEDEDEYDETSVDIKHENMKSSGGNDFYKAHEKTENKLMSAEDAEVGRDATCLSPGNEGSSSHFSKDEDGSPVLEKIIHSTSTTSSSREGSLHLDEYSRNNGQPTEADGGIGEKQEDRKDIGNGESTKNNTCNPDQQESDDPRKGEKFALKGQEI